MRVDNRDNVSSYTNVESIGVLLSLIIRLESNKTHVQPDPGSKKGRKGERDRERMCECMYVIHIVMLC